jgi:Ca-activated chloride channel homolog
MAHHVRILALFATVALALLGCHTPPPARDPGVITAAGALGTPVILGNGKSTVYARIRVTAKSLPSEHARGPVNVVLAMDTSGSMEGAAIADTRKAALAMLASLTDGDYLSVVTFNTRTEVLLPSSQLTAEVRAKLQNDIGAIKAEGTTDLAGGLQEAVRQVQLHMVPKGVNRIVLMGDGIPNEPSGIEWAVEQSANLGVAITTLGLGLDYDETLMGKIATLSGGHYQYVADSERVAAFFREELDRMDAVYGRHAVATITAGPGVIIDEVVGTPSTRNSRSASLPLGDIARGETRDVLVRLTVTPRKEGVPIELVDANVAFDDALVDAGRLERRVYLGARTVLEPEEVAKARNAEVELAAGLAEAAAATLEGMALSKRGLYRSAREVLSKGSQAALDQAKRTPSAALEKHAADMTTVAKDLPAEDKPVPEVLPKLPAAEQAAPTPSSYGYDFHDEQLEVPSVQPAQAAPAQMRAKETHQRAVDWFQAKH